MNTLKPIILNLAELSNSTINFPDAAEPAWTTSLILEGVVVSYSIDGFQHRFTAKKDTTNVIPVAFPNENADWLDGGYVNAIAPFQYSRNTQAVVTGATYTFTITPGERFNTVALNAILADSVLFEVLDSVDVVIHTETHALLVRRTSSWWTYRYAPFEQIQQIAFLNLPINTTNKYRITLTAVAGTVKLGVCISGLTFFIGETQRKLDVESLNFSTFDRDSVFGDTRIVIRREVPKFNPIVEIDVGRLNSVRRLMQELNGVPTLWLGLEDETSPFFEATFAIGLYKDFKYKLDNNCTVQARLNIEGT